jgi:hypothetical protein
VNFKKLFLYTLLSLALVACYSPVWGQEYPESGAGVASPDFERVGSAGFQFLKLPVDARSAAMGGILTSLSHGDASMAFSNPASIADIKGLSANFSQMGWIADINYYNASVGKNFGALGTLALSFMYVDYGEMERTEFIPLFDDAGSYMFEVEQNITGEMFGANDWAFGLSYARNITDRLQFGGTVKYMQQKIDDVSTNAIGIDVGTIYYTGLHTFRIAMLGRNFGPDTEFAEWDERIRVEPAAVKLPMSFVLGGAVDILELTEDNPYLWTVAGEFVHTNDASEKINVGTEFSFQNLISLRAGYRFNYDEEGLTAGAGIRVHSGNTFIKINYSYIDFGRFDSVNMFTVGLGL